MIALLFQKFLSLGVLRVEISLGMRQKISASCAVLSLGDPLEFGVMVRAPVRGFSVLVGQREYEWDGAETGRLYRAGGGLCRSTKKPGTMPRTVGWWRDAPRRRVRRQRTPPSATDSDRLYISSFTISQKKRLYSPVAIPS